jgi:hypothetical protein
MDNDFWKDIQPIEKIEFDIFGYGEIAKISKFANDGGIDIVDLYDNSEPKRGYLIDPRLGTIDDTVSYHCPTCGFMHQFGENVHSYINNNIDNTKKRQQEYTYLNIDKNMRIVL